MQVLLCAVEKEKVVDVDLIPVCRPEALDLSRIAFDSMEFADF